MQTQRNITDRALRYRANKNAPDTKRQCAFCGETAGLIEVGHVDGHEENDAHDNMIWTCRPCNVIAGNTLRAAGLGRLTNQYNSGRLNPATKGATSLGQWMQAVGAITPHQDRGDRGLVSDMPVKAAVEMIRATPQSRRSRFAAQLRKHGRRGNPVRKNIWPFSDSRLSPRNTTAASGGIAKFSRGVKAKAKKAVASAKKSGAYDSIPSAAQVEQAYASGARTLKEALEMAGARLNPAKRSTRNPATESAKAFRDFHGKPVDQFVEVKERIHTHGYLAAAGELRMLEVAGVDGFSHKISGFKGALLAFNEHRNQLFVKGGDQSMNLADFGIKQPHELETLGAVVKIDYFADKKHLGDEGGRAVYRHKFRTTNEDGKHVTIRVARYPDLIYRVLEKRLEFSGGSYEILPEGIDR